MERLSNSAVRRNRHPKYAAYHEAGHAVLADHFNVLEEVTLDPEPRTRFRDVDLDLSCCINYGGVLAQARYQRCSLLDAMLTGGGSDLGFINEVVASRVQLLRGTADELHASWREVARRILRSRWRAVQAVATNLLESGRLGRQRVRQIVADALAADEGTSAQVSEPT